MQNSFVLLKKYLLSLIMFSSFSLDAIEKPWTLLICTSAQESNIVLEQLKGIGSSNLTIAVYVYEKNGSAQQIRKLLVQKDTVQEIGFLTREHLSPENLLADAVEWAVRDFPSEHLAVVVRNHLSCCMQQNDLQLHTDMYACDAQCHNLERVLQNVRGNKKIDVLLLDSCRMGDIIVQHAFASTVHYLLNSSDQLAKIDYSAFNVLNEKRLEPKLVAQGLVRSYQKQFLNTDSPYLFVAIDLELLGLVTQEFNAISAAMSNLVHSDIAKPIKQAIRKSTNSKYQFSQNNLMDIYQFYDCLYRNLQKVIQVYKVEDKELLEVHRNIVTAMRNLHKCTVQVTMSKDRLMTRGISVYFPDMKKGIDTSYCNLNWVKANPEWLNVLKEIMPKNDENFYANEIPFALE